jgi:hypothetical protein
MKHFDLAQPSVVADAVESFAGSISSDDDGPVFLPRAALEEKVKVRDLVAIYETIAAQPSVDVHKALTTVSTFSICTPRTVVPGGVYGSPAGSDDSDRAVSENLEISRTESKVRREQAPTTASTSSFCSPCTVDSGGASGTTAGSGDSARFILDRCYVTIAMLPSVGSALAVRFVLDRCYDFVATQPSVDDSDGSSSEAEDDDAALTTRFVLDRCYEFVAPQPSVDDSDGSSSETEDASEESYEETFTPEELQIQELGSQILNKYLALGDALALCTHIPAYKPLTKLVSDALVGFHLHEHALKFEPLTVADFLLRKTNLATSLQRKIWALDDEFSFALNCACSVFGFKRYLFSASSCAQYPLTRTLAVASLGSDFSEASIGALHLESAPQPNVVAFGCSDSLSLELDFDLAASARHCWPH